MGLKVVFWLFNLEQGGWKVDRLVMGNDCLGMIYMVGALRCLDLERYTLVLWVHMGLSVQDGFGVLGLQYVVIYDQMFLIDSCMEYQMVNLRSFTKAI